MPAWFVTLIWCLGVSGPTQCGDVLAIGPTNGDIQFAGPQIERSAFLGG
jgi:hypothetical protein